MVIIFLGALRFAGLATDVGSLPIDASLLGAIFDATDTVEKWVFNGVAWVEFEAGNPVTTKGDLFTFDTGDARLPVGTADQILSVDAAEPTGLKWIDPPPPMSPLTTKGDIFGFTTVDARFPVGLNGQVLEADSAQAIGLKYVDLLVTKGQLLTFSTVRTELPIGSDGQFLKANSAQAVGMEWSTEVFGDALTSNSLAQFAATTSLEMINLITDETGSGALVFSVSPSFASPILGTPASGNLANCLSLPIIGGTTGTLSVARGGTGVVSSTGAGTRTVLSGNPTFESLSMAGTLFTADNFVQWGLLATPAGTNTVGKQYFQTIDGNNEVGSIISKINGVQTVQRFF